MSDKKKFLLIILPLTILIGMAAVFVAPMNLKLIKCKEERKGLCFTTARSFSPARVDWDKKETDRNPQALLSGGSSF